ncbi:MAG: MarR family transcriptional regulator [Muribaculaceae bacterium]|nr:MarR family transcriptional regulator [Muribaculaceae bacterium]
MTSPDFFKRTGKMALGSRLRLLTERVNEEAKSIYELYGVEIKPKWFPVYFLLAHGEKMAITEIASQIGQTHVSVLAIAKEMHKAGLLWLSKDENDRRRTIARLSPRGLSYTDKLELQCLDVASAMDEVTQQMQNDLWKAIAEIERILDERSLLQRVESKKMEREHDPVQIVPYQEKYHDAFVALNTHWIETYWTLEPEDVESLNDTNRFILDKGGHIFVALLDGDPVGVCAMMKCEREEYDWEIAKYAVAPWAQGHGIGDKLFRHILEKAREMGGFRLFLESNTVLEAAIHIYKKHGFKELPSVSSAYERCNIQMELTL